MDAEFIPRHQLRDRLKAGWHFIPGMVYSPAEYAFLMELGAMPEPGEVDRVMRPYLARDMRVSSNRSRGARNRGLK